MKISIYEVFGTNDVTDENGEIVEVKVFPLPIVKYITSVYASLPSEQTRIITSTNDEGEIVETEEKYTPEFNPKDFYPSYNQVTMRWGDYGLESPVYDNTINKVRTMTRVEKIEAGVDELNEGELIVDNEIVYVKPNPNHIHSVWNGSEWVEGASEQEISDHKLAIKNKYFSIINQYKEIVMEAGIVWQGHKQKLRTSTDIPLLTGSIMALERRMINGEENPTKVWSFSDNDNNVELTLDNFNEILSAADVLVDKCYSAERELKGRTPNLELTLEDFNSLII